MDKPVTQIYDEMKTLERELAEAMRRELLNQIEAIWTQTEVGSRDNEVQNWLADLATEARGNWSGGHTVTNLMEQVKHEEIRKLFREGRRGWGRLVEARRAQK